jgi:hypothetical protein
MNRVQVGLGASLGSIDDGLCGLAGLDWTERLLIDGPRARMQPNKWTLYCEGENGEQTTPSGLARTKSCAQIGRPLWRRRLVGTVGQRTCGCGRTARALDLDGGATRVVWQGRADLSYEDNLTSINFFIS